MVSLDAHASQASVSVLDNDGALKRGRDVLCEEEEWGPTKRLRQGETPEGRSSFFERTSLLFRELQVRSTPRIVF